MIYLWNMLNNGVRTAWCMLWCDMDIDIETNDWAVKYVIRRSITWWYTSSSPSNHEWQAEKQDPTEGKYHTDLTRVGLSLLCHLNISVHLFLHKLANPYLTEPHNIICTCDSSQGSAQRKAYFHSSVMPALATNCRFWDWGRVLNSRLRMPCSCCGPWILALFTHEHNSSCQLLPIMLPLD